MAIRIVGVDLPQNKRGEIALTYIYGIGRSSSAKILDKAGIDRDLKVKDWTDDQAAKIREIIGAEYKVEGDLRSEIQLNIKRLMDIGCYRGIRHRIGTGSPPSFSGLCGRSYFRSLKSTPPISQPTGGIIKSLTMEVTIFPKAPPTITPTAISMAFPFTAKSLNSCKNLDFLIIFTFLIIELCAKIKRILYICGGIGEKLAFATPFSVFTYRREQND